MQLDDLKIGFKEGGELSRTIFMSDYNHSDHLDYAGDISRPSSPSLHQATDRARKAAEELFAPKGRIADTFTSDSTEGAQLATRKPRILSAMHEELPVTKAAQAEGTKPPVDKYERARPSKRIPISDLRRVRTWLEYGLTIRQAADVYGVSVDEIERIMLKR